jgi:osmotically-inducible protein OsmY
MRGNTIVVNVTNGVVLLSGQAPSKKAQQRAEKLTRGIKDVKAVKNQITVQKR